MHLEPLRQFLGVLGEEPSRNALDAHCLRLYRKRKIMIRGVHFAVDLGVDAPCHRLGNHRCQLQCDA